MDTAYRMYEDVEVLINNDRWFNCCYLSGYVLECYCKLVLNNAISEGLITNRSVRRYSHRVMDMENDLSMILLSENQLATYCLDLNSECKELLSGWTPNNRYNGNESSWNEKDKAIKYKEECDILIEQIMRMQLDGVI
jgi:hypothetical protein